MQNDDEAKNSAFGNTKVIWYRLSNIQLGGRNYIKVAVLL